MTYQERQKMERENLIALGFKMGWITVKPPVPDAVLFRGNNKRTLRAASPQRKQNHASQIKKRARFVARGLTCFGKKRKNTLRPGLKGLIGTDYHREHMKVWRAEKQKVKNQ